MLKQGAPLSGTSAAPDGAARHPFLNSLTSLVEAAVHAHLASTRHLSWGTEEARNKMAARLCELTDEVYVLSADRQHMQKISLAECREGVFQGGGKELVFADGRPTISGLALPRAALERALEQLAAASHL